MFDSCHFTVCVGLSRLLWRTLRKWTNTIKSHQYITVTKKASNFTEFSAKYKFLSPEELFISSSYVFTTYSWIESLEIQRCGINLITPYPQWRQRPAYAAESRSCNPKTLTSNLPKFRFLQATFDTTDWLFKLFFFKIYIYFFVFCFFSMYTT